jgi:hypothetical protein
VDGQSAENLTVGLSPVSEVVLSDLVEHRLPEDARVDHVEDRDLGPLVREGTDLEALHGLLKDPAAGLEPVEGEVDLGGQAQVPRVLPLHDDRGARERAVVAAEDRDAGHDVDRESLVVCGVEAHCAAQARESDAVLKVEHPEDLHPVGAHR